MSPGVMTFCSKESIGRTLLRFPQLIWIEVKTPSQFESASVKILTIAHNFLATSSVEMASLWRALPNLQYARSVRLLQWVLGLFVFFFPLHLSPNRFPFSKCLSLLFFPFFWVSLQGNFMLFQKIWISRSFMTQLSVTALVPRAFKAMVVFQKKIASLETEINAVLIYLFNRLHSTWARI